MDPSQALRPPHTQTKRERKLLRHQEHSTLEQRGKHRERTKRWIKRLLWFLIGIGMVVLIVTTNQNIPKSSQNNVISNSGLHWHAKLKIIIKGTEEPIPPDVGLGAVHNPIHTHDPNNEIHMEFEGNVTESDLRLGEFFNTWKRTFNNNCILEFCNGPDGTVTMLVNGQKNTEFENYQMQDNDEIEIRYE